MQKYQKRLVEAELRSSQYLRRYHKLQVSLLHALSSFCLFESSSSVWYSQYFSRTLSRNSIKYIISKDGIACFVVWAILVLSSKCFLIMVFDVAKDVYIYRTHCTVRSDL